MFSYVKTNTSLSTLASTDRKEAFRVELMPRLRVQFAEKDKPLTSLDTMTQHTGTVEVPNVEIVPHCMGVMKPRVGFNELRTPLKFLTLRGTSFKVGALKKSVILEIDL